MLRRVLAQTQIRRSLRARFVMLENFSSHEVAHKKKKLRNPRAIDTAPAAAATANALPLPQIEATAVAARCVSFVGRVVRCAARSGLPLRPAAATESANVDN